MGDGWQQTLCGQHRVGSTVLTFGLLEAVAGCCSPAGHVAQALVQPNIAPAPGLAPSGFGKAPVPNM